MQARNQSRCFSCLQRYVPDIAGRAPEISRRWAPVLHALLPLNTHVENYRAPGLVERVTHPAVEH